MQQTSLIAYKEIEENLTLGKMQIKVLQILRTSDKTNKQIKTILNCEINSITGRTNELVKAGLVEKKGSVIQENGHRAFLWGVVSSTSPTYEAMENHLLAYDVMKEVRK